MVYASPPNGGSGFGFARSVTLYGRSFPRNTPLTVCKPCKCSAFAYSGLQTVVYMERYMPLCLNLILELWIKEWMNKEMR